jgi:hypothetical protein
LGWWIPLDTPPAPPASRKPEPPGPKPPIDHCFKQVPLGKKSSSQSDLPLIITHLLVKGAVSGSNPSFLINQASTKNWAPVVHLVRGVGVLQKKMKPQPSLGRRQTIY